MRSGSRQPAGRYPRRGNSQSGAGWSPGLGIILAWVSGLGIINEIDGSGVSRNGGGAVEKTEIRSGRYLVTTDRSRLDIEAIHDFLSREAYWSHGIPLSTLRRSIENSLCFGLFEDDRQIGFARVISDLATVGYLGDVYILDSHRTRGLSRMLLDAVFAHPELQNLRRWILLTSSADWLYRKYGFTSLSRPEIYLERFDPEVYARVGNESPLTPSRTT